MGRNRQAERKAVSDDEQRTIAVQKFINLLNSTPRAQFEAVLKPLLEENPEVWAFVVAHLRKGLDDLAVRIRRDGDQIVVPTETLDFALEFMAIRISDHCKDLTKVEGLELEMVPFEALCLSRALREFEDIEPSRVIHSPADAAQQAIASLQLPLALVERHNVLPGLRQRLLGQVGDAVFAARSRHDKLIRAAFESEQVRWAGKGDEAPDSSEGSVDHKKFRHPDKTSRHTRGTRGRYPKRAAWLNALLSTGSPSIHQIQSFGGPELRTTRKILECLWVQEGVLRKLAQALRDFGMNVRYEDIPND
jgi:hypothetical protein